MERDKLICPVKRIEHVSSSLDIKVSKPDKESIEIGVHIKGKDPVTPILEKYYTKIKNFIEGKKDEK